MLQILQHAEDGRIPSNFVWTSNNNNDANGNVCKLKPQSQLTNPTLVGVGDRSPMRAECEADLTDDDDCGCMTTNIRDNDDGDASVGCLNLRLSNSKTSKSHTTTSDSGSPRGSALNNSISRSRSSQISARSRTGLLSSPADIYGSFPSADASPTNNPLNTRHQNDGLIRAAAAANNNNNESDNFVEMPDFIVDSKTRVTYLKGKFLGKGGFARVHLVTDLTTDRCYAGKIIAKSHIKKRQYMEKITREVELQSTLEHENVVRFYHFFEDSLNVYIILENCDRMSLAHDLKLRGRLADDECCYFMWQLMDGLQYIHGENIIHRDLKLGNMFLTKDGIVKIGDFGLATRYDPTVATKPSICGTPNYIAPEVLMKQGHEFASDLWSLGCSMYAMLVGFPPFETDSLKETYSKILINSYLIPQSMSHHARALIVHLLHPEPSGRPTLDAMRRSPFFAHKYAQSRLFDDRFSLLPLHASINRLSVNYESGKRIENLNLQRTLSPNGDRKLMLNCGGKASTMKNDKQRSNRLSFFGGRQLSLANTSPSSKDMKMPGNIRMRITRALCPDVSNTYKKKSVTSATLFGVLRTCMENMPDDAANNPPIVYKARVLFIVKWIDYSNRYGFGFELSDHSVGVYFNDSSRMNFSSDRSRLEFLDDTGNVTPMTPSSVPPHLHEKYTVLRYFCQYMEDNLTDGGITKGVVWNKRNGPIPYMKRWLQTSRAIIMQLGNGTLQINFFKDHTKVIVGIEKNDYLVTYINEERQTFTYRLLQLAKYGCDVGLRNRLLYTCNVLGDPLTPEGQTSL